MKNVSDYKVPLQFGTRPLPRGKARIRCNEVFWSLLVFLMDPPKNINSGSNVQKMSTICNFTNVVHKG